MHYINRSHPGFALIAALSLLTGAAGAEENAGTETSCPVAADGQLCCKDHHALHGADWQGGQEGIGLFERMADDLKLSDTQKQEIGTLLEMYRPRIQELAKRSKSGIQDLSAMAPDDPAYNSRAAELSQLAGATAAEMVTLLSELQSNAYALLTEEQQARFLELRAEQKARMEQLRERMQERQASGELTMPYPQLTSDP